MENYLGVDRPQTLGRSEKLAQEKVLEKGS